jgi:cytochrome oxidase Cu insertion factor (SCO1/SenC/PrrC family)
MGMRTKPAALLFAGLTLSLVAILGCTPGDGGSATGDIGEQNGLEVGTTAPDFRMKNQDQATIALSDYKGTRNVILVFYPADFTPV